MTSLLDKAAAAPRALTHRELVEVLTWPDADALFAAAYFCGLVAKERKKNAKLEEEAQTGADDSATEK